MELYGIKIDASRGLDVMRGHKVVDSYPATMLGYACAKARAKQIKSGYIRYWEAKAS